MIYHVRYHSRMERMVWVLVCTVQLHPQTVTLCLGSHHVSRIALLYNPRQQQLLYCHDAIKSPRPVSSTDSLSHQPFFPYLSYYTRIWKRLHPTRRHHGLSAKALHNGRFDTFEFIRHRRYWHVIYAHECFIFTKLRPVLRHGRQRSFVPPGLWSSRPSGL